MFDRVNNWISAFLTGLLLLSLTVSWAGSSGQSLFSESWAAESQKTIKLSMDSDKVYITRGVPQYGDGGSVPDGWNAPVTVRKVNNGSVSVDVSTIPVFVETTLPIDKEVKDTSPFCVHGETDLKFDKNLESLNIKCVRYAGPSMAWDVVEKKRGSLDWSRTDPLIKETAHDKIGILLTVHSFNRWDQPSLGFKPGKLVKPKMPANIEGFLSFLRKAVERYDGDGIDDAPGSPVVQYWQIENEVDGHFWGDSAENYAALLYRASVTIREANPKAKVVMAGMSGPSGFYSFYVPVLKYLNRSMKGKHAFDVFDIHWYGNAGDYRHLRGHDFKKVLSDIREELTKNGYGHVPVWITETATYTGNSVTDRTGGKLQDQSETVQASELLKRYIFFLGEGIERIFWYKMFDVHHRHFGRKNDYFENTGLINNPENAGNSSKKLSYFSFRLMTEKLGGIDRGKIEHMDFGRGIYAYRFTRQGQSAYVLWYESEVEQ